jgi:RNA polymerase sigma-70 factor (ECF subfamily)
VDPEHTELVRSAAQGDAEAFGVLLAEDWPRLVRLARSVLGDAEAEDCVQEGLVLAWQRLSRLDDPGAFSAWLGRIVWRLCLRRARRRRLFLPLSAAAEHTAAPAGGDDPDLGLLLAHLAPRARAVMHLTVVEGMSDREIAVVLGMAATSVRTHRRRARLKLRNLLNGGPRQ